MKTNIIKWGNSQGIRLPKYLLESVNLSSNDRVEITTDNDSIIIKKLTTVEHKTIQDRFENFTGSYEPIDIDWGNAVGNEIW